MENRQESPIPRIQQKSPTTSPMKRPTEKSKQKQVAAKKAQSHTLGNQQESSTIAGNQRKSPTSSMLKRLAEISTQKQSTAKRVKSSTMENQLKSPTNSQLRGLAEKSKQKQPATKRFQPPMTSKQLKSAVPVVTKSPMMRLGVSPVVMEPRSPEHSASPTLLSVAAERSPSPSTSPPPYLVEQSGATHDLDFTSAQSKPRKLRSEIWNDMDPIYRDGKVVQARCKHCNGVFSAARNSGNSHMRRHLGVCGPRLNMHDMVEKLQSPVLSTDTTVLTNLKFDRAVTRCELVRLIVLHELPFSFVEYEGFRSYSLSLNPHVESVSSTTIRENCMEAFKNQRSTLRDIFQDCHCRVSLTSDLWTSNKNTSYMMVTCHYIDGDWKVQKKIIRFCVIETPYDGFNLYSVMLKTISYYNIEDKLFSITLDNAVANGTMMDHLKANLMTKSMLHCDGDLFHVRCAAHVLNLIVKDGLETIDGVINDIRSSIKYITGSQSREERFEEIIEELGIDCKSRPSLDVSTQWNSTYDMLKSAFPFKEAFVELHGKDPNYTHCPSLEEWQRAEVVCKLLKVFKSATQVISGSKYPTSNLYFHEIWSVKQELESNASSTNSIVASMVLEMKNKFEKYWKISYLTNCIPVILDPRFKFHYVEYRLKQAFGNSASVHIAEVDEALKSLYNGYFSEMEDFTCSVHGNEGSSTTSVQGKSWSDWSHHMSAHNSKVKGELDRYLRDDLFPCDDDSFDILDWWKMHSSKYPVVARMARDVLAVPASSVASESAFSTSERLINDHRTRLSGDTLEAIICFQNWLREAGSSYLDIIKIDSLGANIEETEAAT